MPHTPSAKKRMRQSEKRRVKNRATMRTIKTEIKKLTELSKAGDMEKLRTATQGAISKIDRAGSKGVIHPNKAARKKSQLARLLRAKAAPAP